jgi:Fe-Mn family superoxide dismutase
MDFEVPPLPYAKDALAPAMSSETLEYHYEKHHKGYMAKLKTLLEGSPDAKRSLMDLIRTSSGAVFNNAAQVHNHTFFWDSMRPRGGGPPPAGDLADLLQRDFGGWDKFQAEWTKAGMSRFGSGYAWLVLDGGKAQILTTPNAETPFTTGAVPLLTVDVWEHAYYLDHRNRRDGFLEVFCQKLINWDFAAKNLRAAR